MSDEKFYALCVTVGICVVVICLTVESVAKSL